MIPKSMPSGFDPMGGTRFSEKTRRKQTAREIRAVRSGSCPQAPAKPPLAESLAAASGLLLPASGSFASGFCADGPVDFAGTGTVAHTGPSGTSLQARGR